MSRVRGLSHAGAFLTPDARLEATILVVLGLALCPAGCRSGGSTGAGPDSGEGVPTLRELASDRGIGFGTAVDRGLDLRGPEGTAYRGILVSEFDVLTPENDMKHARIHPAEDVYSFARADSLVDLAEAHDMRVRGHTLVWHNQNASWLTDGRWTAREAEDLLREHIASVAGHFRGRLAAWDVVNEALNDDGSLRSTFWSDHIGRAYIDVAFRAARAADPEAELFYNDYGIAWRNPKSDSVHAMLADLLDRGVPVDGIGFQGHFELDEAPTRVDLAANLRRFADLGLVIHITELDVRIPMPASSAELSQQAEDYRTVVEACLDVPACEMVVTWGFTDADSWIPGAFPGYGDALLFDRRYQPKPAYRAVHQALSRPDPTPTPPTPRDPTS